MTQMELLTYSIPKLIMLSLKIQMYFGEIIICKVACRNYLKSYTCQKIINKHQEKGEQKRDLTAIRTSIEAHNY